MKLLAPLFALLISIQLNAQWQVINSVPTGSWMLSMQANGSDTLVICLADGQIFFSDNEGQSFTTDTLPFQYSWINDLSFPSQSVGYACGGTAFGQFKSPIAKTIDGGKSWDSISTNKFGYELYCTYFTDENTGYFGGQNIIVKTTDGGQTFSVDSMLNSFHITDISFTSRTTGYYTSNQHIYKTTDAGQTWAICFTDTVSSFQPGFKKLQFTDINNGVVLSNIGLLISTSDGGDSWDYNVNPPGSLAVTDYDYINKDTAYVICRDHVTMNNGRIYKTVDGGKSWLLQYKDTTQQFLKIDMVNSDNGYVLGTQTLLHTHNGGMGMNFKNLIEKFEVYPNPVRNTLNIKTAAGTEISQLNILDLNGKFISGLSQIAENKWEVDKLAEGYYILQIISDGNIIYKKLKIETRS